MTDPTTRRAEELRERTGIPWEHACLRAERERDANWPPLDTWAREAARSQRRSAARRERAANRLLPAALELVIVALLVVALVFAAGMFAALDLR